MRWKHERYPDWDGSGTIAESWYCRCGKCDCSIDRFTTGEYAYSVSWEGDYLPGAENQPADSFEDASHKCRAIASHFTHKHEKRLTDIAVTLHDKGYTCDQMEIWQPIAGLSDHDADTVAEILEKLEYEDF